MFTASPVYGELSAEFVMNRCAHEGPCIQWTDPPQGSKGSGQISLRSLSDLLHTNTKVDVGVKGSGTHLGMYVRSKKSQKT
eukprot:357839-Chlamydomonas_euryale.AAC.7